MKLPVHIRERDGIVLVFRPELPGCSATAGSEQEALRVLRERVSEYFGASRSTASRGTRVVQVEV